MKEEAKAGSLKPGKNSKKKKMSTKERILSVALELFSQYGYEAVRVEDIAARVGIKAPSLYKHYSGKKAIFDAIMEISDNGYEKNVHELHMDFDSGDEVVMNYIMLQDDERTEMLVKMFQMVVHDDVTRQFRRLMTMEAYHHPEFNMMSNHRYFFDLVNRFEILFTKAIDMRMLKKEDPRTMAVMYVSPMTMLVDVCEKEPQREGECIEFIKNHVKLFRDTYFIGEKQQCNGDNGGLQ